MPQYCGYRIIFSDFEFHDLARREQIRETAENGSHQSVTDGGKGPKISSSPFGCID